MNPPIEERDPNGSGWHTSELLPEGDVRERLNEIDTRVRRVVTQRPLVAVAGAMLLGFVIGRIIGR